MRHDTTFSMLRAGCWGNGPIEEVFCSRVPGFHSDGLTRVSCVLDGDTARGRSIVSTREEETQQGDIWRAAGGRILHLVQGAQG